MLHIVKRVVPLLLAISQLTISAAGAARPAPHVTRRVVVPPRVATIQGRITERTVDGLSRRCS